MMWLRRAMGYADPQPDAPVVSPIENNPVGWSSIYPPQVLTNPDPNVSPVVDRATMTPQALWGALLSGNKRNVTAAELPALENKANTAVDYGMAVAGATQPIRAFHGSPHTFDRFDLSKIGTGEGAQAYGHGLYFAGNEAVAKGYRDALNQRSGFRRLGFDVELGGKPLNEKGLPNDWVSAILDIKDAGDIDRAWRRVPMLYKENKVPEIRAIIDQIREQGVAFKPSGSMYEVSLRTSPERLLDWDKPLSQQPGAVRDALAKVDTAAGSLEDLRAAVKVNEDWLRSAMGGRSQTMAEQRLAAAQRRLAEAENNMTGGQIIQRNRGASGGGRGSIEEALRDAGVDGLQYLDAGSRAAGDGSRNYVMFRDDIIDILRRYGLFGLGMMGTAGAMSGTQVPEP